MTHPAPLPSTTPAADVPHVRLGTARSPKLNNWLTTRLEELSTHTHTQLADLAGAALGMMRSRGHISCRVEELRRAGDLPPKASELVQPAPPTAVPGPQLTLMKEFETPTQTDRAAEAAAVDEGASAARGALLDEILQRLNAVSAELQKRQEYHLELVELACMLEDTKEASWSALSLVRRSLSRPSLDAAR